MGHKKKFSGSDVVLTVQLNKELKPVATEISEIAADAVRQEITDQVLIASGVLRSSITPFVRGNRAGCRSEGAPHALFVEYGTVKMKPRHPFKQAAGAVESILSDAIGEGELPQVNVSPVKKIEGINKGEKMNHIIDLEKAQVHGKDGRFVSSGESSTKQTSGQIKRVEGYRWPAKVAEFYGIKEDHPAFEITHGEYSSGVDAKGRTHSFGVSSIHHSEKEAKDSLERIKSEHARLKLTPESKKNLFVSKPGGGLKIDKDSYKMPMTDEEKRTFGQNTQLKKSKSSNALEVAQSISSAYDEINNELDAYIAMHKQVLSNVKKSK